MPPIFIIPGISNDIECINNMACEAVMAAFKRGEITHSAVSMHFITPTKSIHDYDKGPVFLDFGVKIRDNDTAKTLARRVNKWEHYHQPTVTNLVVNGLISWDGVNLDSLIYPENYRIMLIQNKKFSKPKERLYYTVTLYSCN